MSSSAGSFVLASFWAASSTGRCLLTASSSARIDFCRPTNSGTTMCGKTMMSRSGSRGTRSSPPAGGPWGSRLSFRNSMQSYSAWLPLALDGGPGSGGLGRLLVEDDRLLAVGHDLLRYQDLLDVRLAGDVVHHVEHDVLHDRPQPARARLPLECLARDRAPRSVREAQVHAFHLEELLILPSEGVLRLAQDANERRLVQLLQRRDHGEPSDELGDEAELEQVLRLHLFEQSPHGALVPAADVGAEAHALHADAAPDDVVEPDEGAAADEEDVGGVDLEELLLRVLAAALGRHARRRPLDDLQQRLLHALAGDVAGDRRVVALAGDLVDLVDVHDAALALLDVVVGVLEQREDDVLDVLAHVAGLGEARRVGDGEGHLEKARQRLGEQRLARAGGPDEQDV